MTKDLLSKLSYRINEKIILSPIFWNDKNKILLEKFLSSQNFLNSDKVLSIININF